MSEADQLELDTTNISCTSIPANRLPHHVAIIMDGNNRWAKLHRQKKIAGGHRAGVEAVRNIISCCKDYGIKVLSLFAFSSENWQRPKAEVNALMEIFLLALRREVKKLHENNIHLKVIGDIGAFSPTLQKSIKKAEKMTCNNDGVTLIIAANYGGQWDIARATTSIAEKVKQGEINPEDIDEKLFSQHLSTNGIPDPDLLIRTSGEYRISNFMLWQCAYSEFYFTDTLWPDFNQAEFHQAMVAFANRKRRFGSTSNGTDKQ